MAHIRLGEREEGRNPLIRSSCRWPALDDLVFGGWDPISANALEAARTCGVLDERDLAPLSGELEGINAMDAVFDQRWVKKLDGTGSRPVTRSGTRPRQLIADIETFRTENDCDRLVMVWCGSTEAYQEPTEVHDTVEAFEAGLRPTTTTSRPARSTPTPRSSSGRAVRQRRPQPVDRPALHARAGRSTRRAGRRQGLQDRPDADEDDPRPGPQGPHARLRGWYSTNILGNRDGEVLDDPENFKTKEVSKLGVLDTILQPEVYPTSTATSTTSCASTTTRPAATTRRAGTTSTSSGGWATRCRSRSTSCAATRSWPRPSCSTWRCSWTSPPGPASRGAGVAELLLQGPAAGHAGLPPEHDIFIQQTKLKNTLREWMGEEPVTHSEAG
jgi:myo-inositol-1-phosphate synthase